jgi:hypothetical protein
MPTITVDQIAASFRTAIDATIPRMVEGQTARRWKYAEGDQSVRASSRWYRFKWDGEGFVPPPEGFSGPLSAEARVTLTIEVDYGGIPGHRSSIIPADDWHQLHDVLNRLKSSATGLRWVALGDWDAQNDDPSQQRVVLQYEVRYMKARG